MAPTYKFINKLQDKRVLIFGGTSGIGFGVAEAVLEYGGHVIISGSQEGRLQTTVSRLHEAYPDVTPERIQTFQADLYDTDTLEGVLDTALAKLTDNGTHKLDHVVFTAGDSNRIPPSTLADVDISSLRDWDRVRYHAPLVFAKLAAKYVTASRHSSLTLTSGSNGSRPVKQNPFLSPLVAAIGALSRSLAGVLAPVRVNVVQPGLIRTELTEKRFVAFFESAKDGLLTGEIGSPTDIAEAYLYFMRDANVTAQAVTSDAGLDLRQPAPWGF